MKDRLLSLLSHRHWPWLVVLIGVVLCTPSLFMGIYIDDYLQQLKLQAHPLFGSLRHPTLELFRFFPGGENNQQLIDAGIMPWWANPEIRVAFLRPLSSATHLLDHTLWPDFFLPHHLHSLAWYGAAIAVVALLYRKLIPAAATAGLAAWMFAVEDAHAMPVAWLANRNSLLPLVFGTLALMAHIRWQEDQRSRSLWMALIAFMLALSGGEAGMGALAYIAAWQLTMTDLRGLKRLVPLAPYLVIVLAWRILYNAMGYGAQGSGPYVDPGNEPIAFLIATVQRAPLLMTSLFSQLPVDPWIFLPTPIQLVGVVLAYGVCLVLVRLFRPLLQESALARFFGLGMVFSLVPVCASFPMDRLCTHAGIGGFGLIALLAQHRGFFQTPPPEQPSLGRIDRWGLSGLLLFHAVLAAPMLPGRIIQSKAFLQSAELIGSSVTQDPALSDKTLIWVNSMDLIAGYFIAGRAYKEEVVPKRVVMLTSMYADNQVTRVDENTLDIRPVGGFLALYADRMSRGLRDEFTKGERISRADFEAEVLDVLEDGRPEATRFSFELPLEDPAYHWVFTSDNGAQEFELPPIGESMIIPAITPKLILNQ